MEKFRVEVKGEEGLIREAHDLLLQLGYKTYNNKSLQVWISAKAHFLNIGHDSEMDGRIVWDDVDCSNNDLPIIGIDKLRDLVAQSKSKVREYLDPARGYMYIKLTGCEVKEQMLGNEKWIEIPESAVMALKHHDSEDIFFQNTYPIGLYVTRPKLVWDRQSNQEQGLISGADAYKAIGDGVVVQKKYLAGDATDWTEWKDINPREFNLGNMLLDSGNDPQFKFRLKPRTIKLEIEIPAPFEPKDGESYWILNPYCDEGYCEEKHNNGYTSIGAWRTEEEIKKVVAALRGAL